MRMNPITASIVPKSSPDNISFFITYHQFFSLNSSSANERIIKLAACEPEFPPLEIINGTKRASTTALDISSSKYPMAEAVSISPIKRRTSHPARFFTISPKDVLV